MHRLLWLVFVAAAVAALAFAVLLGWLFPKPARWLEDDEGVQADDYPWRVLARGAA